MSMTEFSFLGELFLLLFYYIQIFSGDLKKYMCMDKINMI